MQFVLTAYDAENAMDKRMEVRPRHLANLASIKGKLLCGGGLLDEEGRMKGSVMVFDFASRELFDEYLAAEPYYAEGVWQDVRVERMNVVILDGQKVGA